MKLIVAVCVSLILSGLAYGQARNGPEQISPEQIIGRIVDRGISEGHDQKVIGRLGDAGAVLVTKVLAGRDLTGSTIDNALVAIEGAFADPSFVEDAGDKQPRTTLLLLKYFDQSANDPALKRHIAEALKYVEDRYTASLQRTMP